MIKASFFLIVGLFGQELALTEDQALPAPESEIQTSDDSVAFWPKWPANPNPKPKCTCKPVQQSKPVCKCKPQKANQDEENGTELCEVHKRSPSASKKEKGDPVDYCEVHQRAVIESDREQEEIAEDCEVHNPPVYASKKVGKQAKDDAEGDCEDQIRSKIVYVMKKEKIQGENGASDESEKQTAEDEIVEYYEVEFKPVKKESKKTQTASTKELAQTSVKIDSDDRKLNTKEEREKPALPKTNESAQTEIIVKAAPVKTVKEECEKPCFAATNESGRTSIIVEAGCCNVPSCGNPCPPMPDCCDPCPVNPCLPDPCCNPYPTCSNSDCCKCKYCFDYSSQFFSRTGLDVFGEGLFWGTNYNLPFSLMLGMFQTVTSPNSTLQITTTDTKLSIQRVNNKWSPGFRAGIGGYTDCDDFDFQLIGTYYENHVKTSLSGQNNVLIGSFNQANANLQLIYRVGDIELGKNYFAFSRMLVRPFCGVRGGWLDQDHRVHYLGKTSTTLNVGPNAGTTITRPTPLTIHLDQDLWCVGPRIGLNTTWGKVGGLSWMANISASLLYGKAHQKLLFDNVSDTLDGNQGTSGTRVDESVTDLVARDRFWEVFPTLQLLMGFSWEDCHFKIYAAYEANFWWEASNILFFDRAISMQGLTAGLGVNF